MDSLTQVVLGTAVGEATLGKKVGNKAVLYGAIAGTIPDLDVVAVHFTDNVTALEIHRGFSHSFLFAILFAPVFGWLISKIERRGPATWKDWSRLMFFGLVTHSLLDAMTTWGTKLFWPWKLPVAIQNIFVIDPLYTIPFLVFVVWTMFYKRDNPKRRKINRLGLMVSCGYLCITLVLKAAVYFQFTGALADQGIEYSAIKTKPGPLNVILWHANVMAEDEIYLGEYSFFDTQPIAFHPVPKNHHLLGDLHQDPTVRQLIRITEGWYTVQKDEGRLFLNDLRFGLLNNDPINPRFSFSYELVQTGEGTIVTENDKGREDIGKLLRELWIRIKGN